MDFPKEYTEQVIRTTHEAVLESLRNGKVWPTISEALAEAGLKVVPIEPTEEMLLAVHDGPLMAGDHLMTDEQRKWLTEMYAGYLDSAPLAT